MTTATETRPLYVTVVSTRHPSGLMGVLFGLALAAASVAVQRLLYPLIAPDSYQLLLSAVAVSVMYAGVRAGLAALLVAGAGKWYLFLERHTDVKTAARFALFILLGLLICWLGQKLHLSRCRLKLLSGLLPVCAWCRKVRVDQDHWQQLETYIHDHSEADFTHTMCPDCAREMVN